MKRLKVFIEMHGNEIPVGEICGDSGADASFAYDRTYLKTGAPISVSLPLQQTPFSARQTSSFFEGLLPEGFTRKSVARWMQLDENDYLAILAGLGRECLGAIQIIDERDDSVPEESYRRLSLEQVKSLAAEGATRSAQIVVNSHLSLTGASGKVGLYYDPAENVWYQPFGTAPSTHIVKQSHVRFSNIVENEQLILRTAEKVGIPVAKSFIVNTDACGTKEPADEDILLATKRYDRDTEHALRKIGNIKAPLRLHQEDFAQALGIPSSEKYEKPGGKYLEKIFRLVRDVSENPLRDQMILLDTLIFDVLIGNTDNHIKNLSLLYSEDLNALHLAPVYDRVCTVVYKGSASEMSFSIAGEREWNKIGRETFAAAAPEMGIRKGVVLREYDRLKRAVPDALTAAAEELKTQGFLGIDELAKKIRQMCGL